MWNHPLTKPEILTPFPATPAQITAIDHTANDVSVRLLLTRTGTRWVILLNAEDRLYSLASRDGSSTKIFRSIKTLRSGLSLIGLEKSYIPFTTPKLKQHNDFVKKRLSWIQNEMKKHGETNQTIAKRFGLSNSFTSLVINGQIEHPEIEAALAEMSSLSREELFPAYPEQLL
ncbi:MAG: hypothetical protein ABJP33_00010 [Pseudoruegeria sp.]